MSISAEQKTHVLNLLKKKYVDWDGFEHQAFRREQINYKRSTVKKAVSLLSESKLAQLLVTRDTDAFIQRLIDIGRATHLLNSTENSNGDLEILYVPTLDKPVFCAQIYHLLHGTEPVIERLDSYLQYIEAHELPNTWTFPTYLLQFCYPDTEFFVEPRPTEWFLKYIGLSPTLGKPTADTYSAIREFAHSLKSMLSEYRPQDMIDIQSVIHVCSMMSEPAFPGLNGYDDLDDHQGYRQENGYEDPYARNAAITGKYEGEPAIRGQYDTGSVADPTDSGSGASWPPTSGYDSDATMLHISEVSDESHTEINLPHDAPPYQAANAANISEGNSLPSIFKQFTSGFMVSPAGVAKAAAYAKAREQAEQNFAHLIAEHELGEKVTDRVFLHLLPHADTTENQNKGAWIHPVFKPAEELLNSLERKFAAQPGIREQVAQVLLEFIRHCVYKPDALDTSSEALARLDALSLVNVSSITPILHALKPTQYLLLHNTSIDTLQRLGRLQSNSKLSGFPELNNIGLQLIRELKTQAQIETIPSIHDTDLFDIFTHWLVEKDQPAPAPTNGHAPPPVTKNPNAYRVAAASAAASLADAQKRYSQTHNQVTEEEPARLHATLEETRPAQTYSLAQCAEDTGFDEKTLQQWLNTLERKRQIIFYGPSGTGKTFMAQQIAKGLTDGTDGIVQLIQFHAGYTYEKFVGTGQKPGDFHAFCTKAAQRTGPGVLIIDEINRTDLGAVFGELLAQLDRSSDNSILIKQQAFSIPENVFIIGTMVPGKPVGLFSDSVARRRFAMIPLMPNYEILKHFHRDTNFQVDGLIRTLTQINSLVENPRYQIGITYFLRKDLHQHIEEIWRFEVEPCIEEAFYNDVEKVDSFRWNKMRRRLTR